MYLCPPPPHPTTAPGGFSCPLISAVIAADADILELFTKTGAVHTVGSSSAISGEVRAAINDGYSITAMVPCMGGPICEVVDELM